MALLECPECTGALSSTAVSCPHCRYRAHPAQERLAKRAPIRGWGALLVAAAYIIGALIIMYGFPGYAVIVAGAALVCMAIELRSGVFRRALNPR